ncbi:UDP-glycosyltransferase 83A1-like [Andrographis paniculata]|uniref:UDP-glycosyltransferase 83A1-like n=1 Tax=Andrographis paniculata TaxID=175694 RepID=UPI0021E7FF00|nr:UDP-glycosyltransferase 83A1-like [Andrographis paniculata]
MGVSEGEGGGAAGHIVAVPFPAQGHVKPLLKLCRQIVRRSRGGIKVTFVNIESIHSRIIASSSQAAEKEDDNIVLTSIPDGGRPGEDQNDICSLLESLRSSMPASVADLIHRINTNSNNNNNVTCVIADITIGWILDTGRKFGAEAVIFSPPSAASLIPILQIPTLLEQGKLDSNGTLKAGEVITLSEDILAWKQNDLPWSAPVDLKTQRIFFECSVRAEKAAREAKWLLTNTCYEIEPSACDLCPNVLPIGPLLDSDRIKSSANFHPADEVCLSWLDTKPPGSVIYVSFGSLAVFSLEQLDELAIGLELSGRAFLWVARPDLANGSPVVYPEGFLERIKGVGKIVGWTDQERVLSHPSTACFLSHCGWNSTMEGLIAGVPFLCWPYFADQAHNQNYVCDKWGVGLRIEADKNGVRSRHEIRYKIDEVFSNGGLRLRENAIKLKKMCADSVEAGGSSYNNFDKFLACLNK